MAQSAWTVTTNRGRRFNVGLYHGEESGHLVVHCNNAITLIDFGVTADKQYTFFLDDELCQLDIARRGNRFAYDFQLDQAADTPLNRYRQSEQKSDRRLLYWGAGMVVLIIVSFALYSFYVLGNNSDARAAMWEELARNTAYPSTEIRFAKAKTDGRWFYSYKVGSVIYEGATELRGQPLFPVEAGDGFAIRYMPDRPAVFHVVYDQPNAATTERYATLSAEAHAAHNPQLRTDQIRCQVRVAYEVAGAAGLAALHYQVYEQETEWGYHRADYLRLSRTPEFRAGVKTCL